MSTASRVAAEGHPTISFELYPPRTSRGGHCAWTSIDRLAAAGPMFMAVTYGADGSSRDTSRELLRHIIDDTGATPMAHLTSVATSRAALAALVAELLALGVRDFLALRGDPPAGGAGDHPDGVASTAECVSLIRDVAARELPDGPRVTVAVAAYPAGDDADRNRDVLALAAKQAAGADYAITQLFYDVAEYRDLLRRARAAGVTLALLPGIIPMTEPRRLHRLAQLTGVPVPAWLDALLDTPDAAVRSERGLAVTARLIDDVLDAGAPGVHLYTFNRHAPSLGALARSSHPGTPALTPAPPPVPATIGLS